MSNCLQNRRQGVVDKSMVINVPKDKLCVVQFMHSGNEFPVLNCKRTTPHQKRSAGIYDVSWSTEDSHYRRLVQSAGWYVDENGRYKKGNLVFWTEWEAATVARQIGTSKDFFKANFVHVAKKPAPLSGVGVCGSGNANRCPFYLNTDPCVFGKTFKYSNCHQSKNGDLRHLAPGSLVVFGSYKKMKSNRQVKEVFCLDTVLVVGNEMCDYTTSNVNMVSCSEAYKNLTLRRLSPGYDYAFYRGVSCRNDVNLRDAIFSFTPVKLYDEQNLPYGRCVLENIEGLNKHLTKAVFNNSSRQGFHAERAEPQEIKRVWDAIRKQVTDHKFSLGVHFNWPIK